MSCIARKRKGKNKKNSGLVKKSPQFLSFWSNPKAQVFVPTESDCFEDTPHHPKWHSQMVLKGTGQGQFSSQNLRQPDRLMEGLAPLPAARWLIDAHENLGSCNLSTTKGTSSGLITNDSSFPFSVFQMGCFYRSYSNFSSILYQMCEMCLSLIVHG